MLKPEDEKAVGGDVVNRLATRVKGGAVRIGDAFYRAGGVFRRIGKLGHLRDIQLGCVEEFEVGKVFGDFIRRGHARIRVFRHVLRHGDGALRHLRQRIGRAVGGGNDGLLFPHENAQTYFRLFRADEGFSLPVSP